MRLQFVKKKVDYSNSSKESTIHMPKLKSTLKKLLDTFKSSAKPPRGVYPSLADLCPRHGVRVPRVLTLLVRQLERRANADGIYARCADADEVESILRNIDRVDLDSIDGLTLAECIKTFLWQLQEPLIPSFLLDSFTQVLHEENRDAGLRRCLDDLPDENRDTLRFLIGHWRKVLTHSLHNGLITSSLATLLAPFVVGFDNERVSIDITEALLRTTI